jgi:hypothetical protein
VHQRIEALGMRRAQPRLSLDSDLRHILL